MHEDFTKRYIFQILVLISIIIETKNNAEFSVKVEISQKEKIIQKCTNTEYYKNSVSKTVRPQIDLL